MPKPFVTTARIDQHRFKVRNRRELEQWASLERDGEYTVTIERAHATRNLEQNALYWAGFVKPLSDHTGYSMNEMHAYLKARFLPPEYRQTKTLLLQNGAGEVIDEYQIDMSTTTKLNKIQFSEYLHEIQQFAAELGVDVGSNSEAA